MRMFLGDTAPVVDVKSFGVKFWVRRRKIHALVTVEVSAEDEDENRRG